MLRTTDSAQRAGIGSTAVRLGGRGAALFDRFVGSDPGLNRLRGALQLVMTIGFALAVESLFVHWTHALQIATHGAPPPAVAAANHAFLVVALLLGAIVGMSSNMGVMDKTARGQLITMLLMPVPMIAAVALGLAIGGNRTVSLVTLAAVLTVGTYLRRFGPRGFLAGLLLFIGDFFGFFLHGTAPVSDLGWFSAEIGVGLLCALVVRFALFYPRPANALARTQRSFAARTDNVAALALALFDAPQDERAARGLRRQIARLNEAALMVDAQLGDNGALPDGTSGQLLHQRLFNLELALTNMARFAVALAHLDLPTAERDQVRAALAEIAAHDSKAAKERATTLMAALRKGSVAPAGNDGRTGEIAASVVIAHRFAGSVIDLANAIAEWTSVATTTGEHAVPFQPSVRLFGGWLPGSTQVSAKASLEPGQGFADRATMPPYTRTAIQMGVAVGAAILLGDALSKPRFYWAVLAAFMTFMGTNNQGEQAGKAVARVLGTVFGIAAGSLIVQIIGHHPAVSIAVILLALGLGFYMMRISYAFFVIGITVTVSQLYVQLGDFTNQLLILRLEETAVGAAVAVVVVMSVLPLRTRRVLRVAMRMYIEALGTLVGHAAARLLAEQPDSASTLHADARDIDASYQALVTTAAPLKRTLFGTADEGIGALMRQAAASRHNALNLVNGVESDADLDRDTRADIERGSATLRHSLEIVAGALNGPRDGTYTRSSSLFDQAQQCLERTNSPLQNADLAIRDLQAIDETMAAMAHTLHLTVTDYDTALSEPHDITQSKINSVPTVSPT
jgi:uncharacterized membrane protein YccC